MESDLSRRLSGNVELAPLMEGINMRIYQYLKEPSSAAPARGAGKSQPAVTNATHAQLVAFRNSGDQLRDEGKLDDALAAYGSALAIAKRLAEQSPTDVQVQFDLVISYEGEAGVLYSKERFDEAFADYNKGLAIAASRADWIAANRSWLSGVAFCRNGIGRIYLAQKKPAIAAGYFDTYREHSGHPRAGRSRESQLWSRPSHRPCEPGIVHGHHHAGWKNEGGELAKSRGREPRIP